MGEGHGHAQGGILGCTGGLRAGVCATPGMEQEEEAGTAAGGQLDSPVCQVRHWNDVRLPVYTTRPSPAAPADIGLSFCPLLLPYFLLITPLSFCLRLLVSTPPLKG